MNEEELESTDSLDLDVQAQVRKWNAEWDKAKETGKQLGLGVEPEDSTEDPDSFYVPSEVQDPDGQYDYNYAVRRELMNHLPRGKAWKPLRDFIYEEKNIFLRRGKKKVDAPNGVIGADSRQAYLHDHRTALRAVREWAARGGTPVEIFYEFYEMNQRAGYRPRMEVERSSQLEKQ